MAGRNSEPTPEDAAQFRGLLNDIRTIEALALLLSDASAAHWENPAQEPDESTILLTLSQIQMLKRTLNFHHTMAQGSPPYGAGATALWRWERIHVLLPQLHDLEFAAAVADALNISETVR